MLSRCRPGLLRDSLEMKSTVLPRDFLWAPCMGGNPFKKGSDVWALWGFRIYHGLQSGPTRSYLHTLGTKVGIINIHGALYPKALRPLFQGFWAQKPYHIGLLGCFEPYGQRFNTFPHVTSSPPKPTSNSKERILMRSPKDHTSRSPDPTKHDF